MGNLGKEKRLGHDWVILDLNYQRKRNPKGVRNEAI